MNERTKNEQHLIAVWMEVTDVSPSYYGVPDSVVLSRGDTLIRNCLSGEVRQGDKDELKEYEIKPEQSSEYLIDLITANTASIEAVIKNQLSEISNNADIEKIKSLDSALEKADWSKIIEECLELKPEQLKNNPKLFKARLQDFLIELITIINSNVSDSTKDKAILKRIENILASHGFEVGDSLEQLVGLIQRFVEDDANDLTDKIEFRKQLKSLSQIDKDNLNIETLMETVISKMDEVDTDSIDVEVEYQKNIGKAVRDIVEEYPLPNFELEDL